MKKYKFDWTTKTWTPGSGWTAWDDIDDGYVEVDSVDELTENRDRDWMENFYFEHIEEEELMAIANSDSGFDELNIVRYWEVKTDEDGDEYTDEEPDVENEIWESEIVREVLRDRYDYEFPEKDG